jgi:hypothetical protein
MLKDLTLNPLVASARVLDTLGRFDERLMRCGIDRRVFVQFCSSPIVANPFGLSIAGQENSERRAAGRGTSDSSRHLEQGHPYSQSSPKVQSPAFPSAMPSPRRFSAPHTRTLDFYHHSFSPHGFCGVPFSLCIAFVYAISSRETVRLLTGVGLVREERGQHPPSAYFLHLVHEG